MQGNMRHSAAQFPAAKAATLSLMPQPRDKWKLVAPCLYLAAGLVWLFIAFARFDGLTILGKHHLPSHGGVLLPSVAGLGYLVCAMLGFRSWLLRRHSGPGPAITTLFGSNPR
jgi:hypothetical protein